MPATRRAGGYGTDARPTVRRLATKLRLPATRWRCFRATGLCPKRAVRSAVRPGGLVGSSLAARRVERTCVPVGRTTWTLPGSCVRHRRERSGTGPNGRLREQDDLRPCCLADCLCRSPMSVEACPTPATRLVPGVEAGSSNAERTNSPAPACAKWRPGAAVSRWSRRPAQGRSIGQIRCRDPTGSLVAKGGIEPPTQGFSVLCSTN